MLLISYQEFHNKLISAALHLEWCYWWYYTARQHTGFARSHSLKKSPNGRWPSLTNKKPMLNSQTASCCGRGGQVSHNNHILFWCCSALIYYTLLCVLFGWNKFKMLHFQDDLTQCSFMSKSIKANLINVQDMVTVLVYTKLADLSSFYWPHFGGCVRKHTTLTS